MLNAKSKTLYSVYKVFGQINRWERSTNHQLTSESPISVFISRHFMFQEDLEKNEIEWPEKAEFRMVE